MESYCFVWSVKSTSDLGLEKRNNNNSVSSGRSLYAKDLSLYLSQTAEEIYSSSSTHVGDESPTHHRAPWRTDRHSRTHSHLRTISSERTYADTGRAWKVQTERDGVWSLVSHLLNVQSINQSASEFKPQFGSSSLFEWVRVVVPHAPPPTGLKVLCMHKTTFLSLRVRTWVTSLPQSTHKNTTCLSLYSFRTAGLFHSDSRWPNRGKVLSRVADLRD